LYSTTKQRFATNRKLCESCNCENEISLLSKNMFVSIDLRYQIDLVLQDTNVRKALIQKMNAGNVRREDGCITDISDGELYRKIITECSTSLTCNINTDGAPLFHKSKRSFWPLQLILNDLPPKIRFKYVLLAGVMIVEHEPTPRLMNVYLEELVKQIFSLCEDGIDLGIRINNVQTSCVLKMLCCSVDSVARAIIQNRVQFNGYFGCSYCYHPGLYLSAIRYPFEYEESELRTHESHLQDVQVSTITPLVSRSRGVKGHSVLASFPSFNMVWGFPLDGMHTIILGVTKHMWELFTKIINHNAKRNIDERLLRIQPFRDLHKLPLAMTNHSILKAKDWKSWLLYYSIPVCLDLLPTENLEHYVLFVKSVYILLQTSITHSELDQCEIDLLKFVAEFENLYGTISMRYNVHSLLHAVQSVRKSGPLWATSAFPYESNINVLKQLVNGPKGVEQQIAKKSLQVMAYRVGVATHSLSNDIKMYCEKLFCQSRLTRNVEVKDGVTFFGSVHSKDACIARGTKYDKCVYNGQLYQSKNYTRSKKWNNSIVQLKSGKIAQITEIINLPDTGCYFNVNEFFAEKVVNFGVQPYVCSIPNLFEAD